MVQGSVMTRRARSFGVAVDSAATLQVLVCMLAVTTAASELWNRRGDDSWPTMATTGTTTALGKPGCSAPVGEKWDRWDMAGSTYNYCYAGCHMDWMLNNSDTLNLSAYAGKPQCQPVSWACDAHLPSCSYSCRDD